MTGELSKQHKQQLEQWIRSGPKDFTLLYSITRDGCSASTFHSKCDNKGPTVTVLYNPSGSIYGGYSCQNWTSSSSYQNDTTAFLFQLQYNNSKTYNIFPVKNALNSIYGHINYGPTFGGGHDLFTFSGTISSSGGYYMLNGGQNYGHSYDMQGVADDQINNGNYQVTELEVYQVTDNELAKEWRKIQEFTPELLENLMAEIQAVKPIKEVSIPRFNILMIGPVGAGKSSFFNTVTSVFRGYLTSQARSGSSEHSLTSIYRMYEIRASASGKPLNFSLCDTRGLEEAQGLDAHEVTFILDGHVPNKYKFNPAMPLSRDTPGFIKSPTARDKIHCVCFIIDGSSADVLQEKVLEKIKAIQTQCNHREIPQVVLLTKVDKLCSHVQDDLSTVFRSPRVKDVVEKVSQTLGLPRMHILPVKNYESEADLEDNVNILTLLCLRHILRSCQDHMYDILENLEDKLSLHHAKE